MPIRPESVSAPLASTMNIGLNVALVPHHSWRGCVAATLISEVVSLTLIWTALRKVTYSDRPE